MVTIVSGHGTGVMTADTVNLGPGGMFLATDEHFDIGDRFICRIDLGEPYKPVLSGAEVRWVDIGTDPKGVGVQFLDIAEAAETLSGEIPTGGPEKVRVRLPAPESSIEAEVIERDGHSLVLELQLPFLEPGTDLEVGPDLAARTATLRKATVVGEDSQPLRLKLDLSLARTSVESAAEKVAAKDAEQAKPAKKRRIWQRPAKIHKKQKASARKSASLDKAVETAAESKLSKKRWSRKSRAESRDKEEPEAEIAQVEEIETAAALEVKETPQKVEEKQEAKPSKTAAAEKKSRTSEEKKREKQEAKDETETAESSTESVVEEEEQQAALESDDEFEPGAFNPFRAPLERILGAALVTRLFQGLAHARGWIGERINGPKLLAAAKWTRDRLMDGGRWTAARVAPLLSRGWKAVRGIKLARKSRKQTRGEPSTVVQHLTDRAARVAARKGRTIALIVVITLGAAGLATAGYGLTSSATAEDTREGIQQEADQAGWTAGAWEEPEPVDSSDS